ASAYGRTRATGERWGSRMSGRFANAYSLACICQTATAFALVVSLSSLAYGADARSTREASNNPSGMQASVDPSAAASGVDADYRLGSGDKVRISVFNQRDLTDIYQVDGLGRIAFPLVGQIQAGGLSPKQLELKIAKVLSPD